MGYGNMCQISTSAFHDHLDYRFICPQKKNFVPSWEYRVFRQIGGVYTIIGAFCQKKPRPEQHSRSAEGGKVAQTAARSKKGPCSAPEADHCRSLAEAHCPGFR